MELFGFGASLVSLSFREILVTTKIKVLTSVTSETLDFENFTTTHCSLHCIVILVRQMWMLGAINSQLLSVERS